MTRNVSPLEGEFDDIRVDPERVQVPKAGSFVLSKMIDEDVLQARIRALGARLSRDYAGKTLTLVGILKGSFLFMADLIRYIERPVRCEFLGVSSYGHETSSSGEVKVTSDLTHPISGEHVLVVEDIIDTGLTLNYIRRLLVSREPASIKICTLLDKKERRKTHITPDYVGFSIPNEFVVGYGLDYQGLLRNLPWIGVLHMDADGADASGG